MAARRTRTAWSLGRRENFAVVFSPWRAVAVAELAMLRLVELVELVEPVIKTAGKVPCRVVVMAVERAVELVEWAAPQMGWMV